MLREMREREARFGLKTRINLDSFRRTEYIYIKLLASGKTSASSRDCEGSDALLTDSWIISCALLLCASEKLRRRCFRDLHISWLGWMSYQYKLT